MSEQKTHRENIGAFWLRQTKRGGHYIKGYVILGGVQHELILFTNTFKTKMAHADYVVRSQIAKESKYYEERS
jgi:hypothetical protein